MIRVLHFNNAIYPYDVVDTALTRLDTSKFDILALTGQLAPVAGDYEVGTKYKLHCVNFKFVRPNYLKMFRALVEEIRRFRPHILHAHGYDENIIASVSVKFTRVPRYVIGRHYSDHIYYLTQGVKRKAFLAAEGFCNNTANRIAVPTQGVAQILTDLQGVSAEKVTVIPFGLDFNKYRPSAPEAPRRLRAQYGLEGKYMALTCSRLNPEKGLEYLLRAIPEIKSINPDFRLVMVGSGIFEGELRKLTHELNLDDLVQFVGWRNDVMDWLAAADLVVHPAFCESWCQVLFEALAVGKPVIMTPVGAAPEVIGDNERGRLIPIGDSNAIVAAITELMADRELGRRLGESGKQYIHQHMGADSTARKYEDLYTTILENGQITNNV